ncbi:glycosyltransferase family 2 protein [Canibacter zhoujuaniae]|uniref:glycosyltransferase family 2 protein n=1 Tax=Canibacter zhoujuaniae TaxID=2708343 RepID=UPI00141E6312|nr:glycosyltransferase [Canibacter zhoujuaniae]
MEQQIDIVIAAHDPARPVQRAVDSVLACPAARVILVAHNTDPTAFGLKEHPRLIFMRLDGSPGIPGAPKNAGLARANLPWVGLLDSDDYFEEGALEAMLQHAIAENADAVLAPLLIVGNRHRSRLPSLRSSGLTAVRDELFYRTGPLGIFKQQLMNDAPDFNTCYKTGEDLRVTAYLWSNARNIVFHWNDPAYVVTNDAHTRASTTKRSIAETGAPWLAVWDEPFIANWPKRLKVALATKLLRANYLQFDRSNLSADEETWAENFLKRLREVAPLAFKHIAEYEWNGQPHKFSLRDLLFYRHSISRWEFIKKIQWMQDAAAELKGKLLRGRVNPRRKLN